MKRKIYRLLRTAALLCMMAVLLCGTASANSLPPEYMVLVKVANRPEEPYYLDLLVPETPTAAHTAGQNGKPLITLWTSRCWRP